ncbi:MAG TPA: hypothetical protein VKQ72_02160 [Aggregatilineales bacterium]|nr:hypothetical protein [Aggregatilineales bacterium]
MNNTAARWIRIVVLAEGVYWLLTGLALLLLPRLFYNSVGDFGVYNQHYMGDAGAFAAGLGLGLIIAYRDPVRHRALIAIAVIASLIHVANHLYDDFLSGEGFPRHFLLETLPLLGLALLLAAAWYWSRKAVA